MSDDIGQYSIGFGGDQFQKQSIHPYLVVQIIPLVKMGDHRL